MGATMLDRREGLAGYLGLRVPVRGVVIAGGSYLDGNRRRGSTLLTFVDVGCDRVTNHVWVRGRDFVSDGTCVPGDVVCLTAEVMEYVGKNRADGRLVTRYGLERPADVTVIGPAELVELVRQLLAVWPWDEVADAVAAAQPDGEDE